MCGIAGANLAPNEMANAKRIARAMLLSIESRGWDATGFAYRDSTGRIQVHKSDVDAHTFVKRNLCLPKAARTFILHTRFATQGHQKFNVNNHPIATGNVVGVHNGCMDNDWEVFRKLNQALDAPYTIRIGDVDSEAIFAMLTNDAVLDRKTALETVQGSAAVGWMDDRDAPNTLHLARIIGSPLIVATTTGGSVLFASTMEAIRAGIKAANLTIDESFNIPEGTYLRIVDGVFADVSDFNPDYTSRYYGGAYSGNYTPMAGTKVTKVGATANRASSYKVTDRRASAASNVRGPQHGITDMMSHDPLGSDPLAPTLAEQRALFVVESGYGDEADPDARDLETVREYEEWWEANLKALDAAVDRDDDSDHKAFGAFLEAPNLNAYYLTDPGYTIETPEDEEYLDDPHHVRREANVDAWMGTLQCTGSEFDKASFDMHADVRPGDTVQLDFDGFDVYGHLFWLPESFPSGDYIIRAYLRRESNPDGHEAMFVSRKGHEFKVVTTSDAF